MVKGFGLNVGKIIKESILDYVESKFSRNIPHPSLTTLLCIKGSVKFNKVEEEKCPKALPLTLTGALKALVESEEGERREKNRKMKRGETVEQPKELAPTIVPEEESSSEKMGALKPTQSSQCSPPLQIKQHQLQLELKKMEKEELKLKKVVQLNYYLY